MKTCKKHFKLGLTVFLICCITEGVAQFTTATVGEQNFGVNVTGRATGNDIIEASSNIWEVSVWEDVGGASDWGFEYNGGGLNVVGLTYSDATDPDICLNVDANGDVHSLIVYYSSSQGEYYIEDFIWNGTTFAPNGINSIDIQGSFSTAINIDSDYDGYYVVVWDVSGAIFARGGTVSSGTLILYGITGIGSSGGNGTYPDVCFYSRNSNRVTYCYLDNSDLIVDSDTYGAITSASSSASNVLTASPSSGFYWLQPRIACPNPSIGNFRDWSVVASHTNGTSNWNILGYNYDFSLGTPLSGPLFLNDGWWMTTPLDLKSVDNSMPVVTYLDQSNEIFVGWTFVNNLGIYSSPAVDAIYPIVISCDYNLNPISNIDYYDVPPSLGSTDVKDALSVSGRHAGNTILCTYYDDLNSDVLTKDVPGPSGGLRQTNLNSSEENLEYLKENNSILVTGRIYDLNGKLLYEKKTSFEMFYNSSIAILNDELFSLYLMQIISDDNNINFSGKILIGK